ncbi:MAG TPA: hypothetical protein VD839_04545 [Burkholderiales bacterium]|jgi:hypothetical protein|nr:hypothetical protein [Burkholderiales bacterium]
MRLIMTAALTLALLAAPVLTRATEGLSGATVGATSSGNESGRHARFDELCRSDPAKCEELRARRAEQREKCKADPEACRAERRARFEKWCEENQEKCLAVRARREQCRENPEQCRAERQARFSERFKQADSDGDGSLSRAEAEKGMPRLARRFDVIDADKDGRVTRDEIEAARKARAAKRQKDRQS